jgi:uncharacterized membrane protein
MKITLVAALLAAAATFSSAPPALADEGDVTWTVRTASNSYGNDRSSYSYSVNPGGAVRDGLVVANRGKDQLDLRNHTDKQLGVGAWVRGATATISVAPGKTAQVPFTVAIPQNATPGDYVGGIVTTLTQPDDAAGINVERRLGIRIKLRVSGELKPALSVEKLHVDYQGTMNPFGKGHGTVSYTIHNTGNATLSAQQAVAAEGLFGWFHTNAAGIAAPPELRPGESWKVSVPLKKVTPAFDLSVTATLTPLLTDAAGSTTPLKPVTASIHAMTIPWPLVVLLVLVIALIAGAVRLSRRNRKRRKTREDIRVQEAVAEALRSSVS